MRSFVTCSASEQLGSVTVPRTMNISIPKTATSWSTGSFLPLVAAGNHPYSTFQLRRAKGLPSKRCYFGHFHGNRGGKITENN